MIEAFQMLCPGIRRPRTLSGHMIQQFFGDALTVRVTINPTFLLALL